MIPPQPTLSYFGMQATFGITKHMDGGRARSLASSRRLQVR